ncbi:MAG: CPBP family intramembrane metalloprotease [Thermoplasmata archaeon]|nr:CPBP family intramembrane metalloprotease [Thermoplasmata archaeon]
MDDIIRGVLLIWAAAFVLLRMDGLVLIYMRRGRINVVPAVLLVLASPVLGLVSVALGTSEGFKRSWQGRTSYTILVYFMIFLMSQVAAGFLAVQVLVFMGIGVPSGRAIGPGSDAIGFSPVMLMLILGLAFLNLLCMLMLFDPKASLDDMFKGKGTLKYSLIGGGILIPVSFISGFVAGELGASEGPVSTIMSGAVGPQIGALIISVSLLAPLSEEIFFRGYLFGALEKKLGGNPAILITAVIFGLAHFNLVLFIPIFLMGLVLGWMRERTGSILPSILVHSMNNTLAIVWVMSAG